MRRPFLFPGTNRRNQLAFVRSSKTPDDGVRFSARVPWDESTRPHRPRSGGEVEYSARGRLVGQHLVDVHDGLRSELTELREILTQVRDGAIKAGDARSALNEMALRQND